MIHRIYQRIYRETRQYNRYICFALFAKWRFNPSSSLIISSETRGGSTWLSELLVAHLPVALNWEPLHPIQGVFKKPKYNYGDRPFVDKDKVDHKLQYILGKILSGKKNTLWTTNNNTVLQSLNAKYLITKFVRANRLLPWMLINFKFNYKPIVLVRHPIAVASSQLNSFKNLKNKTPGFIVPDVKNNETYKEHEQYLNSLDSLLEQQVALWCINNVNILSDSSIEKQTIRVYYEYLLLNPEKELNRIFNEWGFDVIINKNVLRKESTTTGKQRLPSDIETQLIKWRNNLNEDELEKLQSIFDHFELKLYNSKDKLPLTNY